MKTKYILSAVLIGLLMSSAAHAQEVPTKKATTKSEQRQPTASERLSTGELQKAKRSNDVSKSSARNGTREPLASELPIEKTVPNKTVAPKMLPTQ